MKTISLKTLVVMLGACALFATSCKDDDEATPNKTKYLTGGNWQLTAMTSDPAIDWFGTPVTNVYAQLPACLKDDLTIFKSNGTVNFDEGASKCEPNDPQTKTGTWTFNTDQTVLSVTQDGETESWDISELKDNTFKAVYKVVEEGITYTFSVTFTKK
ncbi:MAG: DUF5004 domain-containing protein [Saprospiraceae bacterium]